MLAHVIPDGDNFAETMSTLRFAQKISSVELGAAQSNRKNIEVMELKEEVSIFYNPSSYLWLPPRRGLEGWISPTF